MKVQGANCLSYGSMLEGFMQQGNVLSFVPLQRTAIQHEGGKKLLHQIKSWSSLPKKSFLVLKEEDWFVLDQDIIQYTYAKVASYLTKPIYKLGTYI